MHTHSTCTLVKGERDLLRAEAPQYSPGGKLTQVCSHLLQKWFLKRGNKRMETYYNFSQGVTGLYFKPLVYGTHVRQENGCAEIHSEDLSFQTQSRENWQRGKWYKKPQYIP